VSSTYRIFCLSHDPAIDTEPLVDRHVCAEAEQAAAAGVPGHEECDVLILRYSGALVEIGCPIRTQHGGWYHPHSVEWVDVIWLKLLMLAQRAPEGSPERQLAERAPMPGCWRPERLNRLRLELDLPDGVRSPIWPPPGAIALIHTDPATGTRTNFKPSETSLAYHKGT